MARAGISPVIAGVAGVTAFSLIATFIYVAVREPPRPLPEAVVVPPPPPPPSPEAIAAAADANPTDASAWARLCAVTARDYWRDTSFADCDKAVALQPDSVQPRLDRAFLDLKVGKPELATRGFDAVLKREPANAKALFGRSLIHVQMSRMEAARKDRKQALAIDPEVVRKLETTYNFVVPWDYRR